MEYFIDTNVFLRLVEKENEKIYGECYNFFEKVEEENMKVFTSSLVLAEIVWVLSSSYERNKEYILKVLNTIKENGQVKISDNLNPYEAVDIFARSDVKFVDALIASLDRVQEEQVEIVSYDKDFDELTVKRVEPRNLL